MDLPNFLCWSSCERWRWSIWTQNLERRTQKHRRLPATSCYVNLCNPSFLISDCLQSMQHFGLCFHMAWLASSMEAVVQDGSSVQALAVPAFRFCYLILSFHISPVTPSNCHHRSQKTTAANTYMYLKLYKHNVLFLDVVLRYVLSFCNMIVSILHLIHSVHSVLFYYST